MLRSKNDHLPSRPRDRGEVKLPLSSPKNDSPRGSTPKLNRNFPWLEQKREEREKRLSEQKNKTREELAKDHRRAERAEQKHAEISNERRSRDEAHSEKFRDSRRKDMDDRRRKETEAEKGRQSKEMLKQVANGEFFSR